MPLQRTLPALAMGQTCRATPAKQLSAPASWIPTCAQNDSPRTMPRLPAGNSIMNASARSMPWAPFFGSPRDLDDFG